MKARRFQIDSLELGIGDLHARGIRVAIESRFDAQSRLRGRGGDQADDHLVAEQGLPAVRIVVSVIVAKTVIPKVLPATNGMARAQVSTCWTTTAMVC